MSRAHQPSEQGDNAKRTANQIEHKTKGQDQEELGSARKGMQHSEPARKRTESCDKDKALPLLMASSRPHSSRAKRDESAPIFTAATLGLHHFPDNNGTGA